MTLHSAILITRLDYYFEVLSMFPFHFRIKKNDLMKIKFGSERKEHIVPMLLLVKKIGNKIILTLCRCDETFDANCDGETTMPFYRAQYDAKTGQSPNMPR